jgi:cytochrome c
MILLVLSCETEQKRILVYSPAEHASAQARSVDTLLKIGRNNHILIDTTSSSAYLSEDSLSHYHAIIFPEISPVELDYRQQNDLERYVQAGGGLFVVNANTDTVLNWPWFRALTQERLDDNENPWRSRYDGGHVCFAQVQNDSQYDEILRSGLNYVISTKPDYSDATTLRVPEENRFVTEVLNTYMYEPMEMVIFPDGRVLYLERRGNVKIYHPADGTTRTIATFNVSITGNYEDGMLGVALDPDFENNHWIYINYSPAGDIPKQNVSRFEMIGDSIIRATEKIILEIPTQRETCCHSGGHLEFGPNNDLYISAGDNTSSKESDGFSPIDERPGRAPFDAQKSSANTNDLRGKILRIHPEPDGTYTIPDGNLFPKDGSHGKPEIYVMGTRNAFRFTVDDHNGIVYWGDVGPDGGVTTERGPQSYDEFNQARMPGNYGWPYFVADNKAYADFDFATNAVGPKFNPDEPVNTSPNNTGAKVLPPAQKPMIWYPYGVSKEFPTLGTGSRSAMSGPVYYFDDFKNAKNSSFPKYFDGKLFIYEWARSWVKVVSFDEDVNLARIEPFLPDQTWYKPIDMKFGPDGSLYVLQYGANYFEHNPDSRLVKITYLEGNRQPKADLLADRTVGAVPLTVSLSAEKSFDFDRNETLSYSWNTGVEESEHLNEKQIKVTYDKPGIYTPTVTVTDKEGKQSTAKVVIRAGNEPPKVAIDILSNKSFYFDRSKIKYEIAVKDNEDGSLGKGVDPSDVFFSFDYLKDGKDLALLTSNDQMTRNVNTLRGKMAIADSDCKTCHSLTGKSIGPSYSMIAARYTSLDIETLAKKVIAGGNGHWGNNLMAAHPQHSEHEAAEMVRYILSLSDSTRKRLPLKGSLDAREHLTTATEGYYILRASYKDKGNPVTGSLAGSNVLTLRYPRVEAEDADVLMNAKRRHIGGTDSTFVSNIRNGGYIALKNIDLAGIKSMHFKASTQMTGTFIEVRAGSPSGMLLGRADVPLGKDFTKPVRPAVVSLAGPQKQQDLYFVFHNKDPKQDNIGIIDWIFFNNGQMKVPE